MPTRASTKSRAAPDVRKARALIREVNSMRMREAVSRETRDALARVLDGRVADPATGSGNEAFTEQRDAMRALRDAWVHLADRSRKLGDSVPPIPRESQS
jgi:hypothetical protein